MSDLARLTYGEPDEVENLLDQGPLTEQELRAALMNAFKRIKQLEEQARLLQPFAEFANAFKKLLE